MTHCLLSEHYVERTSSLRRTWWCSTYGCKTNPFHHGCNVVLTSGVPRPYMPLSTIWQSGGWTLASPFLLPVRSIFLSRDRCSSQLRSLLDDVSMDSSSDTSHSFCIGAASSAAAAGLPEHLIQRIGSWTSDRFKTYVR